MFRDGSISSPNTCRRRVTIVPVNANESIKSLAIASFRASKRRVSGKPEPSEARRIFNEVREQRASKNS